MQIYLDYSATTPVRPEVLARMTAVLKSAWGNPSSLHAWGQRSALVLEQARMQVADLIGADPGALVFTAGGTEADNLALFGVAATFAQPGHLIVSAVEHAAVREPALVLERQGWRVTWLEVDRWGRVEPQALEQAIAADTRLVSVIWGQSEVGTLQPIAELSALCQERGILFHTDAVQVAGRLPIDLRTLPVDLLSLSAHKLYGPQGAGALYVRPGVAIAPLLRGGGQETGLRSGTQAVAAIAGFGEAAALAARELEAEAARLTALRDQLHSSLDALPGLALTGDPLQRLPHHLSYTVRHPSGQPITGQQVVRALNLAGIGISAGSACSSGRTVPSRVLRAMGYDECSALGAIRLSLGRHTHREDVEWVAMVLAQVLARLEPEPIRR